MGRVGGAPSGAGPTGQGMVDRVSTKCLSVGHKSSFYSLTTNRRRFTSEYSRFRPPSQGFPKIILMDRYGEFGLDSTVTTM